MTNFEDFNLIINNLISYFTGSSSILAIFLAGIFFSLLIVKGMDFRYASVFTLPLLAFFVAIGWFGTVANAQWITNVGLLVVSLFYGAAILRFTT